MLCLGDSQSIKPDGCLLISSRETGGICLKDGIVAKYTYCKSCWTLAKESAKFNCGCLFPLFIPTIEFCDECHQDQIHLPRPPCVVITWSCLKHGMEGSTGAKYREESKSGKKSPILSYSFKHWVQWCLFSISPFTPTTHPTLQTTNNKVQMIIDIIRSVIKEIKRMIFTSLLLFRQDLLSYNRTQLSLEGTSGGPLVQLPAWERSNFKVK